MSADTITEQIIVEGKWVICTPVIDGKSRFEDTYKQFDKKEKREVLAVLKRISEVGPPRNVEKFRNEGDGIYAIKHRQIRIYCFFDKDKLILLTHGVKKKKQKLDPKDLKIAKKIKRQYFEIKITGERK